MRPRKIQLRSTKAIRALLLATVMSLGFAACTDKDDATAQNPLGDKIIGTFFQLYHATGTVDHVIDKSDPLSEKEISRDYTRVVEVYQFQNNGTGLWNRYFLDNKSSEPFAELGQGSGHPGSFEYTTHADGTVSLTLTSQDIANQKEYQPLSRQLTLADGRLTATGIDGQTLSMEKDEGAWENLFSQWNLKLRGGADAITYNINDADFTPANWHDVEAIYINDGSVNITINNMKDPASYKIVNLPWYNGEGDVASNLPDGFCDNITPENGWALVLNRCGSVSPINDNFLALYHAYSGTLRFFYYVPDNFQAGNDHVWEVTLPDDMAQLSLWGYGLPTTATIKKKELISAAGSGTMADIVTAWSGDKLSNGLLTLRTGWWAFDVDLSLYRPDGIDFEKDKMKLQMYSWDKHDVSLFSTMEADINGTIKADMKAKGGKKSVSVAKGILTGLQGALSLASGIAGFMGGNPAIGFGGLSGAAGAGSSIAGMFDNGTTVALDGTISLGMNGTITTQGVIAGAAPNIGIASPTISLRNFKRDKAPTLGQGVWNIKNHPTVYVLNNWWSIGDDSSQRGNIRASYYFFDPSSIEVQLNPTLFPESDIEWMQVDATCIGTNQMGIEGTDKYREAFGLAARYSIEPDYEALTHHEYIFNDAGFNLPANAWDKLSIPFDFLKFSDDKGDMKYPVTIYTDDVGGIFGRGYDNSYAIEPTYIISNGAYHPVVPGLEVVVIVTIKKKGVDKPYVYSRNYLPELRGMNNWDARDVYKSIKNHQLSPKQKDRHASYDYQVQRIKALLNNINYIDIDS